MTRQTVVHIGCGGALTARPGGLLCERCHRLLTDPRELSLRPRPERDMRSRQAEWDQIEDAR